MILCDVNIFVYAYRQDSPKHREILSWLLEQLAKDQPYGISEHVLSGFLRVVTHPKIFNPPSPLDHALQFVDECLGSSNCVRIAPGPRHWEIFVGLCKKVKTAGNLIPDAYFAALAIESGCTWVTTDYDYSRFPGLDWQHPIP